MIFHDITSCRYYFDSKKIFAVKHCESSLLAVHLIPLLVRVLVIWLVVDLTCRASQILIRHDIAGIVFHVNHGFIGRSLVVTDQLVV